MFPFYYTYRYSFLKKHAKLYFSIQWNKSYAPTWILKKGSSGAHIFPYTGVYKYFFVQAKSVYQYENRDNWTIRYGKLCFYCETFLEAIPLCIDMKIDKMRSHDLYPSIRKLHRRRRCAMNEISNICNSRFSKRYFYRRPTEIESHSVPA